MFPTSGHQTYLSVVVKGGHMEHVPLSAPMAEAIRDWLLHRDLPDAREPLLVNAQGQRYSRVALAGVVWRIGKAAKITRFDVTPHVLRHTLNLIRRRAKIDPVTRSRLLTHTSLSSLASYEHVLPADLHSARDQQRQGLSDYLGL